MAPNGGLMRTAVTGIPYFDDADRVQETTVQFCKATHADPRCVASAVLIAECVRGLIEGKTLNVRCNAIARARRVLEH